MTESTEPRSWTLSPGDLHVLGDQARTPSVDDHQETWWRTLPDEERQRIVAAGKAAHPGGTATGPLADALSIRAHAERVVTWAPADDDVLAAYLLDGRDDAVVELPVDDHAIRLTVTARRALAMGLADSVRLGPGGVLTVTRIGDKRGSAVFGLAMLTESRVLVRSGLRQSAMEFPALVAELLNVWAAEV